MFRCPRRRQSRPLEVLRAGRGPPSFPGARRSCHGSQRLQRRGPQPAIAEPVPPPVNRPEHGSRAMRRAPPRWSPRRRASAPAHVRRAGASSAERGASRVPRAPSPRVRARRGPSSSSKEGPRSEAGAALLAARWASPCARTRTVPISQQRQPRRRWTRGFASGRSRASIGEIVRRGIRGRAWCPLWLRVYQRQRTRSSRGERELALRGVRPYGAHCVPDDVFELI